MIKGIIFDIDDTLYSHKMKAVPSLTLKALKKLKEKGYKLGVCTSREVIEMESVPSELLELFDCQIMSTGGVAMIKDQYYKAYSIDKENVKEYIKILSDFQVEYAYSDINGDVYYWNHGKNSERRIFSLAKRNVYYKEYEDEDISCLMIYDADEYVFDKLKAVNPNAYISRWGRYGHISAEFVDKSFGVLKFCQLFSFTTDEVVAVGDGGNDDIMLQMANIGIAVKDAKENTIKAADYVCKKSIEDGGLYQAFVDLGLIEDDEYHPRLFFFDIDSTSFDHSIHDVRESTYLAFDKLHELGYKTCICTSRDFDEAKNLPKKYLDSFDYASYGSGTYIKGNNKVLVRKHKLSDAKDIAKILDENHITYRYATLDGKGFLNQHDEAKEALFYRLYEMVPEVKPYEGEEVTFFLYYDNGEARNILMNKYPNLEHIDLKVASELYPEGVNKGYGVKQVSFEANIDIKDTCAFGDSNNDIDMLKVAGLAITMGNGTYEAKQVSDYITDDISEEGLYNALVHFKIIEGKNNEK